MHLRIWKFHNRSYPAWQLLIATLLLQASASSLAGTYALNSQMTIQTGATFDSYYQLVPVAGPAYDLGAFGTGTGGSVWTPGDTAVFDVNGDGLPDIVDGGMHIPNSGLHGDWPRAPLRVLINKGNGRFEDQVSTVVSGGAPMAYNFGSMAVADFNGDGKPDLFAAGSGRDMAPFGGETNILLLSGATGAMQNASSRLPQINAFGHDVAVGSLRNNGAQDVILANIWGAPDKPYVLLNDGRGNFTRRDDLLPASWVDRQGRYTAVKLADFNGDGFPDLVVGAAQGFDSGPNEYVTSRIFMNDGRGSFANSPAIDLPLGCFTNNGKPANVVPEILVGDFNGDGKVDILLGATRDNPFYQGGCLQMLINDGTGRFADETASRFPEGLVTGTAADANSWPQQLRYVDVNQDGYPDIIVGASSETWPNGQQTHHDQRVFFNDGTGRFYSTPSDFFPRHRRTPDNADMLTYLLTPIDLDGRGKVGFIRAYQYFTDNLASNHRMVGYEVMIPLKPLPSPFYPAVTSSGTSSALTLATDFQIGYKHSGSAGEVYVAFLYAGSWYFYDGRTWGTQLRPYFSGVLPPSISVPILDRLNVSGLAGGAVYVGYGNDINEMLKFGRYASVLTVR